RTIARTRTWSRSRSAPARTSTTPAARASSAAPRSSCGRSWPRRARCDDLRAFAVGDDRTRPLGGERTMKLTDSRTMRVLVAAAATLLAAQDARAAGDEPVPGPQPTGSPSLASTAPRLTNEGLALANAGNWAGAEEKYRAAIRADRKIPEAWNGLGHALKKQA